MKRRSCIHFKHQYGCAYRWSCELPCKHYKLRRPRKSKLFKRKVSVNKIVKQDWHKAYAKEIKRLGLDK